MEQPAHTYTGPDGQEQHMSQAEANAIAITCGPPMSVHWYASTPSIPHRSQMVEAVREMHQRPGAIDPGARPVQPGKRSGDAYVPYDYGYRHRTHWAGTRCLASLKAAAKALPTEEFLASPWPCKRCMHHWSLSNG
jgi:hypothetical protein